jgi:hypothetical protein
MIFRRVFSYSTEMRVIFLMICDPLKELPQGDQHHQHLKGHRFHRDQISHLKDLAVHHKVPIQLKLPFLLKHHRPNKYHLRNREVGLVLALLPLQPLLDRGTREQRLLQPIPLLVQERKEGQKLLRIQHPLNKQIPQQGKATLLKPLPHQNSRTHQQIKVRKEAVWYMKLSNLLHVILNKFVYMGLLDNVISLPSQTMQNWERNEPIPLDATGVFVLVCSLISNIATVWIIGQIIQNRVQMMLRVKWLMLTNNIFGLLWSIVSIIRYYIVTYPYLTMLHITFGVIILIGDFMAQIEILKLFHFITNLRIRSILIFQWCSLGFCLLCVGGTYLGQFFPDNQIISLVLKSNVVGCLWFNHHGCVFKFFLSLVSILYVVQIVLGYAQ